MLSSNSNNFNISNQLSSSFNELGIFKALKHANIYKRNGKEANTVFTIIFSLVFYHLSWNQFISSKYNPDFGKDVAYRFLNSRKYNWRRFLHDIALNIVTKVEKLTDSSRVNVFIIDDSPYDRNRSKKTEMLSNIFDHVSHSYIKGFHLLALGWSDGATFIPVDFALVATVKTLINGISSFLDKRSIAYKRRNECLMKKTDLSIEMVKCALKKGIYADYVLMDSWFVFPSVLEKFKNEVGIDVIGMVKNIKPNHFVYNGKSHTLDYLYSKAMKTGRKDPNYNGILASISAKTGNGLSVQLVFVTNRNKSNEYLTLITTDLSLSDEEIIRIYEKRWSIECFFKSVKSTFKLEKEFISNSFDALIAHTSIVFTRYIVTAWEIRKENDIKTLGELFLIMCDDIRDITFIEAFNSLLDMIIELANESGVKVANKINSILEKWYSMLPQWLYQTISMSRSVV
ncbi:MAG: transposase [Bacilli bacterium]|nr:transposase [Bacilli bacterium]